jgi:hypothetical protein
VARQKTVFSSPSFDLALPPNHPRLACNFQQRFAPIFRPSNHGKHSSLFFCPACRIPIWPQYPSRLLSWWVAHHVRFPSRQPGPDTAHGPLAHHRLSTPHPIPLASAAHGQPSKTLVTRPNRPVWSPSVFSIIVPSRFKFAKIETTLIPFGQPQLAALSTSDCVLAPEL